MLRGGVVRGAPDLVQRPVVGAVQRPGGAVRGHARRAAGGVDVTRALVAARAGAAVLATMAPAASVAAAPSEQQRPSRVPES